MHGGLSKHGNVIAIGGSVSPNQNMFVHNAAATQAEQERLFSGNGKPLNQRKIVVKRSRQLRDLSQDFAPSSQPSTGVQLPPMIKTPKDVTRPSERNGGYLMTQQTPLTPNEGSSAVRQSYHLQSLHNNSHGQGNHRYSVSPHQHDIDTPPPNLAMYTAPANPLANG